MNTKRISSNWIAQLEKNEIFVFNSNLAGLHGGGAARTASQKFDAVWEQSVGLHGQTYYSSTMQDGVETIKPYIDELLAFAKAHYELKFPVMKIDCDIAGFTIAEIASLFHSAINEDIENVFFCFNKSVTIYKSNKYEQ
jgi:hypothetical protein